MSWLRHIFSSKWVRLLPKIKSTIDSHVNELFEDSYNELLKSNYSVKDDKSKLTRDVETMLEVWYIKLVGSVVGLMNYIPKSDDEDFWGALNAAIADENSKRPEKDLNLYMPYYERYSNVGYPIKEPEEGKGVNLLAEDLASHFLGSSPPEAIEILQGKIIEFDKRLCYEIANLFGDKVGANNILNKTSNDIHDKGVKMFNWLFPSSETYEFLKSLSSIYFNNKKAGKNENDAYVAILEAQGAKMPEGIDIKKEIFNEDVSFLNRFEEPDKTTKTVVYFNFCNRYGIPSSEKSHARFVAQLNQVWSEMKDRY